MCQRTYDYKDESKDVKAKVSKKDFSHIIIIRLKDLMLFKSSKACSKTRRM